MPWFGSVEKEGDVNFWEDKRVIVTGGAGFLGSYVVEKLHQRGAAEVIVPRSRDYDLRNVDAIHQLLFDTSVPTAHRRSLTAKPERLFGFKATSPFEEGLWPTIEWYKSMLHVAGLNVQRQTCTRRVLSLPKGLS